MRDLTPMPERGRSGHGDGLPDRSWRTDWYASVGLLAVALAARGALRKGDGLYDGILERVDAAHRAETVVLRESMLADVQAWVETHPELNGLVMASFRRHAKAHGTRETFLMSLLLTARAAGSLATARFTWLKAVDRSTWYALNNLGRTTFHVEGLAAISHLRAELAAGKAIAEPKVEEAIEILAEMRRDGPRGSDPAFAGDDA